MTAGRLTARVAVVGAPGATFDIGQVELQALGENQVAVRVAGTGICQTDLHVREGHLYAVPYPVVLGHESAGVVEAIGGGVTKVRPGDSVILTFSWCRACESCSRGRVTQCEELLTRNYTRPAAFGRRLDAGDHPTEQPVNVDFFGQSSFSDIVVCDEWSAIPVAVAPADGLEILGPLACSVMTGAGTILNAAQAGPGDSVLVFGVGAVGLSAVMAAAAVHAHPVIAVDVNPQRLELAAKLGAHATVNASDADVVHSVRGMTGRGVDIVCDCTGNAAVVPIAFRALRAPGRYFLVGALAPGTNLDIDGGRLYGRSIAGVTQGDSYPPTFIPDLVKLWRSGALPIEAMITKYPLAAIEEAAQDMRAGRVIKPVLIP